MADSDYDAVRPIDRLQTVRSLSPTQRRQERRRQQMAEDRPEESAEEPAVEKEPEAKDGPEPRRGGDSHLVDYCA